ncbi:hypothetical protein WN51_04739 [Melipona quadrifasciata]|uniref:Uncharacterized protein n=1 Tax=Melipona quadrifasciata TaxID=166423 RepID=A0A0M8ZUM1_9HYME|nr:hypothetical protein WN51_04739 [Melipona quadrifasciata]
MVRFKNRYIVFEINFGDNSKKPVQLKVTALHNAIQQKVQQLYGDFGVAAIKAGFSVSSGMAQYNADTKTKRLKAINITINLEKLATYRSIFLIIQKRLTNFWRQIDCSFGGKKFLAHSIEIGKVNESNLKTDNPVIPVLNDSDQYAKDSQLGSADLFHVRFTLRIRGGTSRTRVEFDALESWIRSKQQVESELIRVGKRLIVRQNLEHAKLVGMCETQGVIGSGSNSISGEFPEFLSNNFGD